jgi:GTPase SAR1 family protein|tara:strand:+ start:135 stop:443 length:309 start_codon:yes stop_codon:yes gene_type:complete
MANYKNMMDKWKDWRLSEDTSLKLSEDKIKMGFAGFDSYFKNIERNIEGVKRTFKMLIKDLAQDTKDGDADYKKQVLELQSMYKKYVIELEVKLKQFKRKNT